MPTEDAYSVALCYAFFDDYEKTIYDKISYHRFTSAALRMPQPLLTA